MAIAVTAIVTAGIGAIATGASFSSSLSAVMAGNIAAITSAAGTSLTTFGAVVVGAAGAAVGSLAGQGLGIAIGAQDKINWKGVGLAAISGGIAGGMSSLRNLADLGKIGGIAGKVLKGTDLASKVARAVITNVAGQELGKLTHLQDKFSWSSVAASAIAAGTNHYSAKLNLNPVATSGAVLLAEVGTRSLVDGTDFGDNILAALPDTIAQLLMEGVAGAMRKKSGLEGLSKNQIATLQEQILGALSDSDVNARYAGKPPAAIAALDGLELTSHDSQADLTKLLAEMPTAQMAQKVIATRSSSINGTLKSKISSNDAAQAEVTISTVSGGGVNVDFDKNAENGISLVPTIRLNSGNKDFQYSYLRGGDTNLWTISAAANSLADKGIYGSDTNELTDSLWNIAHAWRSFQNDPVMGASFKEGADILEGRLNQAGIGETIEIAASKGRIDDAKTLGSMIEDNLPTLYNTTVAITTNTAFMLTHNPDYEERSERYNGLAARNWIDNGVAAYHAADDLAITLNPDMRAAAFFDPNVRAEYNAASDRTFQRGKAILTAPIGAATLAVEGFAELHDRSVLGQKLPGNYTTSTAKFVTGSVGFGAAVLPVTRFAAIGDVGVVAVENVPSRLIGSYTPSANLKYGTTLFGDEAHVAAGEMLTKELYAQGVPVEAIIDRTRPGLTGVDMSIDPFYAKQLGFEHIEIKPNTANGLRTLNRQVDRWGMSPSSVQPVTYDAHGNIWWGFDF